jgi:xanthine/uracil/vitamin C permease (AzgA family)
MGIWARLPFVLAPGLEMNGFIAFSAIGLMGLTVSQALGSVFWSGVLCILLTWLPVRALIIRSIPLGLQSNLALSVGVFVLTIGLFLAKLLVFEKGLPSGLGSVFGSEAIALGIGLLVCVVLRFMSNSRLFLGRLVGGGAFPRCSRATTSETPNPRAQRHPRQRSTIPSYSQFTDKILDRRYTSAPRIGERI